MASTSLIWFSVIAVAVLSQCAEGFVSADQRMLSIFELIRRQEAAKRLEIFKDNLAFIEKWNSHSDRHKVAMNAFGDLSAKEYISFIKKHPERIAANRFKFSQEEDKYQPKSGQEIYVDWRTKGVVGPVRDEDPTDDACGISIAEAIEGCAAIASGRLNLLSTSQVDQCVKVQDCVADGWAYVVKAGGLVAESQNVTSCFNQQWAATITGYSTVQSGSESALEAAVNVTIPQVGVDASQQSFMLYDEGVYYEPSCSSTELDHVGYGYDDDSSSNFWIVKNSWGDDWGENGYILMTKDHGNNCGIATSAVYGTGCM